MRLYLGNKLPDQKQDEEPADNVRYLAERKANYTGADYRKFTYQTRRARTGSARNRRRHDGPDTQSNGRKESS